MKRFRNIHSVHSGNARANGLALEHAGINRGGLTVLKLLKDLPDDRRYKIPLERYLREEVEADVKKALQGASESSIKADPSFAFASGELFIETIGKVLANKHDFVIKAVESRKERRGE